MLMNIVLMRLCCRKRENVGLTLSNASLKNTAQAATAEIQHKVSLPYRQIIDGTNTGLLSSNTHIRHFQSVV
jgi:hypothetical protein